VSGGGAFLTTTVLVELTWVLRLAAKLDRSAIAEALRRLVICKVGAAGFISRERSPNARLSFHRGALSIAQS
jgi:predicted nucleic-acid-binding protein